MSGKRHTEETKARMRAAERKRSAPMPADERAKHSASMIGKHRIDGPTRTSDGRLMLFAPDHPAANEDGRVLRARLVAEEKISRLLHANELVHHINFDWTDDHPDNVHVMDRGEHSLFHWRMRTLGIENHFRDWFSAAERAIAR